MDAHRVAEGLATPWLGVKERVFWYAYQLWFAMLAVRLFREGSSSASPAQPKPTVPGRTLPGSASWRGRGPDQLPPSREGSLRPPHAHHDRRPVGRRDLGDAPEPGLLVAADRPPVVRVRVEPDLGHARVFEQPPHEL